MTRWIFWILFGILFTLFEISFIRSLPGVLVYTPFVFALCVYVVQHQGVPQFIWWLPLHGIILDLYSVGHPSVHLVSYVIGALIISISAKQLFSNRSYYGVVSCALIGFFGVLVLESSFLFVEQLYHVPTNWLLFLEESVYRIILLLLVITLFYPFAKRIRSFLLTFSLLPELRKTY